MHKKFFASKGKRAFTSELFDIIEKDITFEGSKKSIKYKYVKRPDVVIIVPVTNSGNLLLTYQYRAALNNYVWEFPAGHIREDEAIEEAALRELEEETGKKAKEFIPLGEFHIAPHYCSEKAFLFEARNLQIGVFKPNLKEIIYTYELSRKEIRNKIQSNEIIDAKTLLAFYIYIGGLKNGDF